MKRRSFLRGAAVTSIFAANSGYVWAALEPDNRFRKNMGLQLYTLRNELKKDMKGTIQAVADAGYQQGEAYNFPNCVPMMEAMKEAGLALNSTHFDPMIVAAPKDEGMSDFSRVLDQAGEAGVSHLVIPYLQAGLRKTLDGYKKLAENLNKASEKAKAANIQLAYHNHSFEFAPMEGGKSGFDVFIKEFGPAMKFELDVFWVKLGGREPADLIRQLKGRVSQLHLKDLAKGSKAPNYAGPPKEAFKEIGNGMIPMEPILKAAGECGVAHTHVEQDHSPHPVKSIQQSMEYIRKM